MMTPSLSTDTDAPTVLATSSAGPTRESERIDSLDVLRGFALLGILVMNVQSFGMPSSAYLIPNAYGDLGGANFLVWLVGHLFFDAKFMAMFSMMFGAGIVLMSERAHNAARPSVGIHYRRMGLLLAFGLIHAYGIWYGDILTFYALCGMVVFWVRRWPALRLAIAGVLLITIGSAFHVLTGLSASASPEMVEALREGFGGSDEAVAHELEAYRGPWLGQLGIRASEAAGFQFFLFPFLFFWRISGLMLLGMALFKFGFLSANLGNRSYSITALIAGSIGLITVGLGACGTFRKIFGPSTSSASARSLIGSAAWRSLSCGCHS